LPQELGIPYEILSASEMNPAYRAFMQLNYKIPHMYEDFEEQVSEHKCLYHRTFTAECLRGSKADLAVLGTPCPLFSCARTKRYRDGSVESHHHFSATFQTAYRFLAAVNPAVAILEQVEGFTLPFSTTDETTPKERQVGVGLYPAGFKF